MRKTKTQSGKEDRERVTDTERRARESYRTNERDRNSMYRLERNGKKTRENGRQQRKTLGRRRVEAKGKSKSERVQKGWRCVVMRGSRDQRESDSKGKSD